MAKIQPFLAFLMVGISDFIRVPGDWFDTEEFGSEKTIIMFAGHAGTDVAIYSSKNLFQNLRNNDSYKAGQIEKVVVVVVVVV
jgi:hypothetical protein